MRGILPGNLLLLVADRRRDARHSSRKFTAARCRSTLRLEPMRAGNLLLLVADRRRDARHSSRKFTAARCRSTQYYPYLQKSKRNESPTINLLLLVVARPTIRPTINLLLLVVVREVIPANLSSGESFQQICRPESHCSKFVVRRVIAANLSSGESLQQICRPCVWYRVRQKPTGNLLYRIASNRKSAVVFLAFAQPTETLLYRIRNLPLQRGESQTTNNLLLVISS
jgi:hypothetical protein